MGHFRDLGKNAGKSHLRDLGKNARNGHLRGLDKDRRKGSPQGFEGRTPERVTWGLKEERRTPENEAWSLERVKLRDHLIRWHCIMTHMCGQRKQASLATSREVCVGGGRRRKGRRGRGC